MRSEPPHPAAAATFSPQTGRRDICALWRFLSCLDNFPCASPFLLESIGYKPGPWPASKRAARSAVSERHSAFLLPVCGEKVSRCGTDEGPLEINSDPHPVPSLPHPPLITPPKP